MIGTVVRVQYRCCTSVGPESMSAGSSRAIFISYAWNVDDSFVDRVYQSLCDDGYDVRRDNHDIQYGDSITRFMEDVGDGRLVVVIVSDSYLRSIYCMRELLSIYRNQQGANTEESAERFRRAVLPIILADAQNSWRHPNNEKYLEYWESELESREAAFGKRPAGLSPQRHQELKLVQDFSKEVDTLLCLLGDMNALSPKLIEAGDFDVLKRTILNRLSQHLEPRRGSRNAEDDSAMQALRVAVCQDIDGSRDLKSALSNAFGFGEEAAAVVLVHRLLERNKASDVIRALRVTRLKLDERGSRDVDVFLRLASRILPWAVDWPAALKHAEAGSGVVKMDDLQNDTVAEIVLSRVRRRQCVFVPGTLRGEACLSTASPVETGIDLAQAQRDAELAMADRAGIEIPAVHGLTDADRQALQEELNDVISGRVEDFHDDLQRGLTPRTPPYYVIIPDPAHGGDRLEHLDDLARGLKTSYPGLTVVRARLSNRPTLLRHADLIRLGVVFDIQANRPGSSE